MSEMDEVKSHTTGLVKAREKATNQRQKDILNKKISALEAKYGKMEEIVQARIQIHVYEKRMRCDAFKKYWSRYKTQCERLKEKARL